jgi:hypothetical protein
VKLVAFQLLFPRSPEGKNISRWSDYDRKTVKIRGKIDWLPRGCARVGGVVEIFLQISVQKLDQLTHFSAAKVSGTVHILFTSLPFRPASGLRLETATEIDKKKSELYFLPAVKKILTENVKRTVPRAQRNRPARDVDAALLVAHHFPFLGVKIACNLR